MRGGRTWSNYISNVRTRKLGVLRHGAIKEEGTAAVPPSTGQEEKGLRKYRSLRDRREKGTAAYETEGEKGTAGRRQTTEQKVTNPCKKECFCARLKDECALFYNLLALSRLGITWCGEK